jgi:PAS domain S-box-containing protein
LLAAIVEASEDAIVSKTLDGVVRSWNRGAERLFGYTAQEAVGQPITLIIPPERQDEELAILERLRRGQRIEHFETVRITKDGRRIDISLTVSPLFDGSGRVIGASKVARDFTERKRAEAALVETDRKKDEFIALLAHELRNPLAPMRSGLQILRISGSDAATIGQVHEMMDRQLDHLVRIVEDLLDVARISVDKLELRRTRVPLSAVIESAVETARSAIVEREHELVISLPGEPLFLNADLTRLAQVFSNLVTNAAKYTNPGGKIWLTARRHERALFVAVRDTGVGIPAEWLPRIFDMFSQVSRSIERSSGGLGIGLALVKGLVEMHGGDVLAESEGPAKGSTFTVRLPIMGTASEPVFAPAGAGMLRELSAGRKILVVDDNRDAAISLATLLRLLGNETRTAHDGIHAVESAEAFQPDVILMDVGMPGQSGYDATRRIRSEAWGCDMTIVALTGWGQQNDRRLSKEAGCDGHLVKPVSLQDLETLLADLAAAGRE